MFNLLLQLLFLNCLFLNKILKLLLLFLHMWPHQKNAEDGNVNQIAGPPAAPGPPLEVKLPFLFNSHLLGLYTLLFFGLFCVYTLRL